MKEKIFEISEHGPFKAKVDERFHKLGIDCPDDGWVTGYLFRDLDRVEVAPFIFNCPCRWRVVEETIEPVGFHIAQWIKVKDRLPEYATLVLVAWRNPDIVGMGYCYGGDNWRNDDEEYSEMATPHYWMPIVPPKED
jgi:hypothetical protein